MAKVPFASERVSMIQGLEIEKKEKQHSTPLNVH
jgi:hypothetical protein